MRGISWVLVALLTTACRVVHPSELPSGESWLVAVKSARLADNGAAWKRFAHHAFLDVRRGSEAQWQRLESGARLGVLRTELSADEARLDTRFGGGNVRVLGWLEGDAAERAVLALDARAAELARTHADDYTAWPGPNSNTLVADLIAHAPGLAAVLDGNCLGKDDPGWFDVGLTASKTGVRIDTVPIGVAVALREGIELHLAQLTIGVSLDPPGLSLPFLPQIPWGFLPGRATVLRPPESLPGTRLPIDVSEPPTRRRATELDGNGTLVFTAPDESGWLRVDFTWGQALTPQTTMVELDVRAMSADGSWRFQQGVALEIGGHSPPVQVSCGAWSGLLWLHRTGATTLRVDAAFAADEASLPTAVGMPSVR
jgi:hypothetical protein